MAERTQDYDIIFTGGGAAGLSLCYRGLKQGVFSEQQILIIDPSSKTKNDKTWCFWEAEAGPFESIVHKHWKQMSVYSNKGEHIDLRPGAFEYKMIRSIDFYEHCLAFLRTQPNVTFLQAEAGEIEQLGDGQAIVPAGGGRYKAKTVFNSVYRKPKLKNHQNYFLQHFLGEVIRLPEGKNNPAPNRIHLMDFRVSQKHGTAFMYFLPLHNNEVLVEYTLFTKQVLERHQYKAAIKAYLSDTVGISNYEVVEEEFGIIPMTDVEFQRFEGCIVNIGSAGGDTRGSSGGR